MVFLYIGCLGESASAETSCTNCESSEGKESSNQGDSSIEEGSSEDVSSEKGSSESSSVVVEESSEESKVLSSSGEDESSSLVSSGDELSSSVVSSSELWSSSEVISSDSDPYAFDLDDFPKYDGFTLLIAEEFNEAPANPQIWESGDGTFGGNLCRFGTEGLEYTDSSMYLVVKERHMPGGWSNTEGTNVDDRNYTGGELGTIKQIFKYGRMEARIRGPEGSGWVTSIFWFHFPKTHWREFDMEIEGQHSSQFKSNVWEEDGSQHPETEGPKDYDIHEWNIYGIEWGPGYVTYSANGEDLRTVTADPGDFTLISDDPLTLLANFWISDFGTGFGGPNDGNVYPLKAEYDWIRYYELDSHPIVGLYDE